ncbi:MAG: hypothetical protein WC108_08470 [Bacteroidales bacterium]|jgi:hypothetical protein|nr:hypothetical protein [Bacilli bacterium]
MKSDVDDNITKEVVVTVCHHIREENVEIIRRDKNEEFLNKYEYTRWDVQKVLNNLKIADYRAGPEKDRKENLKHPVWIFSKHLDGIKVDIYIKIKVINRKRKIIVLSFHEEGL